ncbi:hypothetical protein [Buttiauxella noackiae]|uniref:VgrG-related protein n=1 Tax=Buttiauxella noackiae TaxID=82992 RepID=UPI0012EDB1F0
MSDGDSLTPVTPVASDTQPAFGEVVKATPPVAISAGDGIGHMGFFQLPEDNGKLSRYQVHLECLSPGDKLVTFLTNPDNVDVNDKAAYLKYEKDAALFMKNGQGQIVASTRRTRNQGIATRSKVATLGADGQPVAAGAEPAYYQINAEFGWLAAASIRKVSQYALGELGFVTLDKTPESFDLIDGIKQPNNVVKGILEQMYQAASDETRSSHAMNEYNYKRLLEQIDANHDGHYSEGEYLQAVHNRSYRDHLYRIITKHGSEWYYGKDDPLWKMYLDALTQDAPDWKKYTEAFIDKVTWMKKVPDMEEKPWHMHPLVFLGALTSKIASWVLGTTSEHYESAGRGPGVISTGRGDHGGVSYGCYQLSSNLGVVQQYIDKSKFKSHFQGLQAGSEQFNNVWRNIANSSRKEFADEQFNFIKETHYDVQIIFLAKKGIVIKNKRAAIHDMIWSTSVQYGPYNDVIYKATAGMSFDSSSDAEIITAVQDYKYNHVESKFVSSPNLWPGLKARALDEKNKLLELAQTNYEVE